MKIVIFNTQEQATEYFDRDYGELISPERIVDADALARTIAHHSPKSNADGKYYYPALDGADYTGIETGDMQVSQPVQEPTEPVIEPVIEPTEE